MLFNVTEARVDLQREQQYINIKYSVQPVYTRHMMVLKSGVDPEDGERKPMHFQRAKGRIVPSLTFASMEEAQLYINEQMQGKLASYWM